MLPKTKAEIIADAILILGHVYDNEHCILHGKNDAGTTKALKSAVRAELTTLQACSNALRAGAGGPQAEMFERALKDEQQKHPQSYQDQYAVAHLVDTLLETTEFDPPLDMERARALAWSLALSGFIKSRKAKGMQALSRV